MATRQPTRRQFLRAIGRAAALTPFAYASATAAPKKSPRPNILLITADDMNWNTPGCFGGETPEITPNIDRFASGGMRILNAHITIAVCQPCRSVLMTGRYPHRNGAEGFEPIDPNVTTLQEKLHEGGYLNAIFGKVGHLAPVEKFKWDVVKQANELKWGRDPQLYGQFAKSFFQQAKNKGQPFFLMANSQDPHRPFHGSRQEQNRFAKVLKDIPRPSRVYREEEVRVPGFLPDLPEVRREIAQYYSSVRRCDDTVGAVTRALEESGQAENTLTMFLSDNGMALPFAKTNCYMHSTRTPWIVSWPRTIKRGATDTDHFISAIDFMPTVLEAAGLTQPDGMDGFSFLPILLGRKQSGRDKVFTQFHQTAGRKRYPMRCVQNHRFGYIFNPWSDGQRIFRNESQSGLTFKAMQAAAATNPQIADRVRLFQYRVVEEFYDFKNDPDALHNLVGDPEYGKQIDRMRTQLADWMKHTDDPALQAFSNRNSPDALKKFMAEQDTKAHRRQTKPKPRKDTRAKQN